MIACMTCGNDVTGRKFCPACGTSVHAANASSVSTVYCPRCNGMVQAGVAFCMHCGSALRTHNAAAQTFQTPPPPPPPATRTCMACHAEVPMANAFCTNCGHDIRVGISQPNMTPGSMVYCNSCGRQNTVGVSFCAGCGSPLRANSAASAGQANYQPARQYARPPAPYPPQQPVQYQPQYAQQPMMGQAPMALRCPTCMALAPMGTPYCAGCRTSLAGVVPTPANMPAQGQKSGVGGFLQSGAGQMAIGALGGAAAVIGGEMLLHGVEDVISDRVEENMEFGERHHHQRDKGLLGNLGHLADDIGLF
ncbi:MAG: hypothetical protein E6J34_23255 [Chloroflexi bacterium]|nr:MAG: hypothetical protein E6J34_23255 [Chloroflexota bacterium]